MLRLILAAAYMEQAVRKKTVIGPGGRVDVSAPELVEGSEAEVIILVEKGPGEGVPPLSNMGGILDGAYGSSKDIDRYIRELRDEWD